MREDESKGLELNASQSANMVAMGGLAHVLKRVSVPALTKGLMRVLPKYRDDAMALYRKVGKKTGAGDGPDPNPTRTRLAGSKRAGGLDRKHTARCYIAGGLCRTRSVTPHFSAVSK
jgi:hypothetical protein